ncbi:MAG: phosphatidate cytidylyltransferase [bacterium]|nr:phosphatidate cytidylyltransferase [bacterium]
MQKSSFVKRAITTGLFVPILFYLVFLENPLPFFLLITIIISLCLLEFYRLFKSSLYMGLFFGILLSVSCYYTYTFTHLILVLAILTRFTKNLIKRDSLYDILIFVFGIIYIGFMLSHLILLRRLENGQRFLLFLFLVTWMTDIFAYLIGIVCGRHKFILSVSPNKSLEGTIGGGIIAILTSILVKSFFLQSLSLVHCLILGSILGIFTQLGDLAESLIKRDVGVKDSGDLIPGHGGVLDVFDSLIFTSPIMYYYVTYFL